MALGPPPAERQKKAQRTRSRCACRRRRVRTGRHPRAASCPEGAPSAPGPRPRPRDVQTSTEIGRLQARSLVPRAADPSVPCSRARPPASRRSGGCQLRRQLVDGTLGATDASGRAILVRARRASSARAGSGELQRAVVRRRRTLASAVLPAASHVTHGDRAAPASRRRQLAPARTQIAGKATSRAQAGTTRCATAPACLVPSQSGELSDRGRASCPSIGRSYGTIGDLVVVLAIDSPCRESEADRAPKRFDGRRQLRAVVLPTDRPLARRRPDAVRRAGCDHVGRRRALRHLGVDDRSAWRRATGTRTVLVPRCAAQAGHAAQRRR